MSFISYAQNLEDVMLYRALKHVERGFYIDVGAQHPVIYSVTKAFYDRGWRGINVEPNPEYFQLLREERPKDINLNTAVGTYKGKVVFYEVLHTGLSSVNKDYADLAAKAGYEVQRYTVPCTTLDAICAKHKVDTVQFLNIDVEGAEKAVLEGFAFTKIRPWVVVIEANEPSSNRDVSQEWESMLLSKGYEMVYYDGLNRFYLAKERFDLRAHFGAPPNILDAYISHGHWFAQQELTSEKTQRESLATQMQLAQQELTSEKTQRESLATQMQLAQQELTSEKTQRESLATQLQRVYASRSWWLTAPLRKGNQVLGSLLSLLVRAARQTAGGVLRILLRYGWLRRLGARLLAGRPDIRARLLRLAGVGSSPPVIASDTSLGVPSMSTLLERYPSIRRVLKYALNILNRFPALKSCVRHVIAHFPRVENRLLKIWSDVMWFDVLTRTDFKPRQWIVTSDDVSVATKPICLSPVEPGLATPQKRPVYYWIDHTAKFQANVGVQRVTRCLARGLMELGTEIVFVCWNEEEKALAKAMRSDLEHLSGWHGPGFSHEFLASHSDTSLEVLHKQITSNQLTGAWLIIPEVTHITFHNTSPTLDVIDYAKAHGMKVAFIFYDAILLKLEEYAGLAKSHADYMQHIALADLLIPISMFSAGELVSFYRNQLYFHPETFPMIRPVLLSGETCDAPRATEYDYSEDELLILSVGTIEPRKNQVTLLKAFQNLCNRFPELPLRLVLCGNCSSWIAPILYEAMRRNPKVEHLSYVDDKRLWGLYQRCIFSVFPSVEEGFGLPIIESLWHGKPVICANFGAMAEVAQGGGCLTVDTRSVLELESAIERILLDQEFRERLAAEVISRPILSWREYAAEILATLDSFDNPVRKIDKIYYWVEHTCTYPYNSEIQRVARILARTLQQTGVELVPVKWDNSSQSFRYPKEQEILHLSRWNGPEPGYFGHFSMSNDETGSWLLIPELTTYPGGPDLEDVVRAAKYRGLHTAIIFYDALPYKLAQLYPPQATKAHAEYMKELINFDHIFPTSKASFSDLQTFLFREADRLVNIETKLNPVTLPGEFCEQPRVKTYEEPATSPIRILCVGTIEPRKNHLVLLESFNRITSKGFIDVELVLVGDSTSLELEQKINAIIEYNSQIRWLRNVDDAALAKEYAQCHFTVYPSLDEGFGLPVLESLWHARPCICHNSGAMAEVAKGGGCLTVDTSNVEELAKAMLLLATDKKLRARLGKEAVSRHLKTWAEYAWEIVHHLALRTTNYPVEQAVTPTTWQPVKSVDRPLLSICITTYNHSGWLALSLKTLVRWAEPYRNLVEIIVCDNASEDGTPEVVKPFLNKGNFRYHRNPKNVGMLGNLKVTAHLAQGRYVWILGDDDIVKEGAVEAILSAIQEYPDISLIYLNYAYTHIGDAAEIKDVDQFLRNSTPTVPPTPNQYAKIKDIATISENFFTGIYCQVFRRDHALRAYSQNTSGRPFSTMLSCLPTSYYVCNYMFEEMGLWIGEPALVVNFNVSWHKYAPLFVLERRPEVYDLAEQKGADPDAVDKWRAHLVPGALHYLSRIYFDDQVGNLPYFSIDHLFQRYKHIDVFRENLKQFIDIYKKAYSTGKLMDSPSPDILLKRYDLKI